MFPLLEPQSLAPVSSPHCPEELKTEPVVGWEDYVAWHDDEAGPAMEETMDPSELSDLVDEIFESVCATEHQIALSEA